MENVMSHEDFLAVFNAVLRSARPVTSRDVSATSMDDTFSSLQVDSLDFLMSNILLCDIFEVAEDVGNTIVAKDVRGVYDFYMEHKTVTPSLEAALECIA